MTDRIRLRRRRIFRIALAALACSPCAETCAAPIAPAHPHDYRALPPMQHVPYVWQRHARGKHLVVIGTLHLRDPHAPMFDAIDQIFARVRPQIVLHESEVPDAVADLSRDEAIRVGADAAFAVRAAREVGAQVVSGDAPPQAEMHELLRDCPAADVFVFLVVQRLIGTDQRPDWAVARSGYADFYRDRLVARGLPDRAQWRNWTGFLDEYRRVTGNPLAIATWDPRSAEPFRNSGRLSQLARTVDAIRDRWLLAAIREALKGHDRVVVVFGGAHVRALEPLLDTLLR